MEERIRSFGHAIRGIRHAIGSEIHMKIHLVFVVLVVTFGFLLQISLTEWLICFLAFGLVLSLEVVNTSIERIVDLVSPEHHPLAGQAKDAAAGAVLIASIFAAIAGLTIFLPKIWVFLFS